MNILVTHSTGYDFKNKLYIPIRTSSLNDTYHFFLPHENDSMLFTLPLMQKKELDIMIAEVSYPSTGQGIEMGWAYLLDIPILCMYQQGMKYSGALKTVSKVILEYKDEKDMISIISNLLSTYAK